MRYSLMLLGQVQQAAAQAGIVLPQNVYALASEMAETLGFQTPGRFFTDPQSPEFKRWQQQHQQQQRPDPKVEAAKIAAQGHIQKAQIDAQSSMASANVEQQMHARDLMLKMEIEKGKAVADLAKAEQGNNASVITAYLNARQKHDEALMNLLSQSDQTESQERQAFVKALAGTAGAVANG